MFFPAGLAGIRIRSRSIHSLGGRCRHFRKGFVHKEPKRCKIKTRYIYGRWLISCFTWMSKKSELPVYISTCLNLNGMCHWNTSDILLKSPFKYASDLIWSDRSISYLQTIPISFDPGEAIQLLTKKKWQLHPAPPFFLFLKLSPVVLFLSLPKHCTSDCYFNLPN